MTSHIVFAFVSGFLLATVIFWIVNRKQRQDWQAEYRRLMGGIHSVMIHVEYDSIPRSEIAKYLKELHNGDEQCQDH